MLRRHRSTQGKAPRGRGDGEGPTADIVAPAVLADLFVAHGPPERIGSDGAREFTASAVREGRGRLSVKTALIAPASPWESGCDGSFDGKLWDGPLDRGVFHALAEPRVPIGASCAIPLARRA